MANLGTVGEKYFEQIPYRIGVGSGFTLTPMYTERSLPCGLFSAFLLIGCGATTVEVLIVI